MLKEVMLWGPLTEGECKVCPTGVSWEGKLGRRHAAEHRRRVLA
jgi:hypothetical protein